MNLDFTPEEELFREEVRTFITDKYPAELRAAQDASEPIMKEHFQLWHRVLAQQGWVAPSWPVEHGGTGWTSTQRYIWSEELSRANCLGLPGFGLSMLAPVIYTFGSEEQKQRFLPGIFSGDFWWCQGYSEPGAGSDLASLRTRAERFTDPDDGRDYYRVTGQKTWTTFAQWADWGFFLVRTDATVKPQAGISFLLIDMKSPGVTVRPIITLDGEHEVNDVYLDDVKVPVENRIYEENKGWTCAKALLAHERTGIANVGNSKRLFQRLLAIAQAEADYDGAPLITNPFLRRQIAELAIQIKALEITELRTLAAESHGGGPGPESSILKVRGSELQQDLQHLTLTTAGLFGTAASMAEDGGHGANRHVGPDHSKGVAADYFNGRKSTIYGGSNEIQRNIIAKTVLGI